MNKPLISISVLDTTRARAILGSALLAIGTLAYGIAANGDNSAPGDPCKDTPEGQDKCVDVRVYFDGDCPVAVDNWAPVVQKGGNNRVRWVAYNLGGDKVLSDKDYDIYFDPFVGPQPQSKGGGVVVSPIVKPQAPSGSGIIYKYTILADGCDQALDPFIRIQ